MYIVLRITMIFPDLSQHAAGEKSGYPAGWTPARQQGKSLSQLDVVGFWWFRHPGANHRTSGLCFILTEWILSQRTNQEWNPLGVSPTHDASEIII